MKDPDRQACYDAEALVWGETLYEEPLSPAVMAALVEAITDHPTWVGIGGTAPVEVRAARREALQSQAYSHRRKITLSLGGENCATLVHELAHVATRYQDWTAQAHGALWRTVYVDLAVTACGAEAASRLARRFESTGLPLAAGRWPEPAEEGPYGLYGALRSRVSL